jgi:signal-transduction protein with cAMP-binding, CBS, and nucleotidyltransferase domain
MQSEIISETLRKCQLFAGLSDEELNPIVELAKVEEYKKGDIIYEQGHFGTKLYCLSKGQVSLLRRIGLSDGTTATSTVYILRQTRRRRIMGCWCTLLGENHIQMCSAKCDKPSRVVSMACSDLSKVFHKNPGIQTKILEKFVLILRDRLESSYAAMETL